MRVYIEISGGCVQNVAFERNTDADAVILIDHDECEDDDGGSPTVVVMEPDPLHSIATEGSPLAAKIRDALQSGDSAVALHKITPQPRKATP